MSFTIHNPFITITDPPPKGTKQLSMPSETDHLFCSTCRDMHKRARIPDRILFFTRLTPDALANDRGFMPLIKAFSAFYEWATGTKVEWLLTTPNDSNVNMLRATELRPHVLRTFIIDLTTGEQHPDIKVASDTAWYAASSGYYGLLTFKQKALGDMSPVDALAFMCHEVTAHLFDTGVGDVRVEAAHYSDASPYLGHCATEGVGDSICMNKFTSRMAPNHKNALPFFKKWYDDHKDDPITTYKRKKTPPVTPPISDSEEIPAWPEMPPSLPPDDEDPVNLGQVINEIEIPPEEGSLRAQASPPVRRSGLTLNERIGEKRRLRKIDVPNLKEHEAMRLILNNHNELYARDIQSLQQVEEP